MTPRRPPALRPRRDRAAPDNQQWLLGMLPAFPLVLLVLRLWYAGRQDTQTLLLLVQYVSPLGMLSSILIIAVWIVPAVVLTVRALGGLYQVSAGTKSWLVGLADRVPDWVVVAAAFAGLLGWQLRFLPALLMMVLAVAGLSVRDRFPDQVVAVRMACVVVPAVVGAIAYVALAPAIVDAVREGEPVTLALLAVPPGLALLLTGPIPRAQAWLFTHGIAMAVAVLLPIMVGAVFLRVPVLPLVAVEVAVDRDGTAPAGAAPAPARSGEVEVVVGNEIAVDDRMSTMLDREGTVRFIPNTALISKILCPEPGEVPRSRVDLLGWYVEQSMVSWLAPDSRGLYDDPRCQGRPRHRAASPGP
ncbi:hypothetical protein Sru01_29510 [Sphaerisporangium rufum]|uniref:Uncharacterized protein n=2 Tax=Sphaerisporangium rufum TaxID=1381558 RepID=A0A919UZP3_9ACTN|nr:hypothetical protein Sru01_29510 [Sphaerisporangium rufum]